MYENNKRLYLQISEIQTRPMNCKSSSIVIKLRRKRIIIHSKN